MTREKINKPSRIAPKEFTRLWNMLLIKSKKEIAHGNTLPRTVLALEDEKSSLEIISFVVDRVNADPDFMQELYEYTKEKVYFTISRWNKQIQIEANRIEAR